LDYIVDIPLMILQEFASALTGPTAPPKKKDEKKDVP
jgi:hypothetical protein